MLGAELTRRWGGDGLPDGTIDVTFHGSAGQSFGAFVPRGITLRLEGDANDYFGKGLSGGTLVLRPPPAAKFVAEENVIAGNVILYGATGGDVFIRGMVGERFCVRNSGRDRGGRGRRRPRLRVHDRRPRGDPRTDRPQLRGGHERAASRSSATPTSRCSCGCNRDMVDIDLLDDEDGDWLRGDHHAHLERHRLGRRRTRCSSNWWQQRRAVPKVFPKDYKRVLEAQRDAARARRRRRRGDHGGEREVGVMGETTGFMKYGRKLPTRRPIPVRILRLAGGLRGLPARARCARRARAAWTAAFRSATPAARSGT